MRSWKRFKCWRVTDGFGDVWYVEVGVVFDFEACVSGMVRDDDFVRVERLIMEWCRHEVKLDGGRSEGWRIVRRRGEDIF